MLPLPSILNKVRENFRHLPRNAMPIGVHIRRTDCIRAIEESPDEEFRKYMSEIRNGYFYVMTDDSHTFSKIQKSFPGQTYSHERIRNRCTVEGIQEAVVSLYTLASCSIVIGSYAWSFSRMAAIIGSKEAKIMRLSLKE
jgi:hypothetical protein